MFHSQLNKIGHEGAEKIGKALAINNTLTTLHLQVRLPFIKPFAATA